MWSSYTAILAGRNQENIDEYLYAIEDDDVGANLIGTNNDLDYENGDRGSELYAVDDSDVDITDDNVI
jgi:hypothetical protein